MKDFVIVIITEEKDFAMAIIVVIEMDFAIIVIIMKDFAIIVVVGKRFALVVIIKVKIKIIIKVKMVFRAKTAIIVFRWYCWWVNCLSWR